MLEMLVSQRFGSGQFKVVTGSGVSMLLGQLPTIQTTFEEVVNHLRLAIFKKVYQWLTSKL